MRRRTLLSIGEVDAEWVLTSTGNKFRFYEGSWQCSRGVWYGKDKGWFDWSGEPAASQGEFVEISPDHNDAEFANIISLIR